MTAENSVTDEVPPDNELAAAELALGLADPEEQGTNSMRLASDPAFAAAHARWIAYALALCDVRSVEPDEDMWRQIRRRLPVTQHAPTPRPARHGLLLASAAAIFIGGVLIGHWAERPKIVQVASRTAPSPSQPLIAVLTGSEGGAVVAVSSTLGGDRLTAVPKGVAPGPHVTELWVIPAGGRPVALGVLPHMRASVQPVNAALRRYLQPGATLALSLEPAGGSPTGQPTGKVILSGTITEPS